MVCAAAHTHSKSNAVGVSRHPNGPRLEVVLNSLPCALDLRADCLETAPGGGRPTMTAIFTAMKVRMSHKARGYAGTAPARWSHPGTSGREQPWKIVQGGGPAIRVRPREPVWTRGDGLMVKGLREREGGRWGQIPALREFGPSTAERGQNALTAGN